MTDFLTNIEETLYSLNEATSYASYMNVDELRHLYYGRVNILVSFSNDEKLNTSGYYQNRLIRPKGILGYSVEDVVGRRVSSNRFYGHVYRDKVSNTNAIRDIQSYSSEDLGRDLEKMKTFSYINPHALEDAIIVSENNPRMRRNFEVLWSIMQTIIQRERNADRIWARLFQDLGYDAITDQRGLGFLSDAKASTTLIFDHRDIEMFDIVPIQKYRTDPRRATRDKVDRIVERLRTRRRTVAKKDNLNASRGKSQSLIKGFFKTLLT